MTANWMVKTVAAGLAVFAVALPARADGAFGFSFSYAKHRRHHRPIVVEGHFFRGPAPVVVPAPVVIEEPVVVVQPLPRVWVPPEYKTVVDRVWVPTVTTAYRDVPVCDVFGNVVSYRRVPYTVRSGYWKEVPRQVMVRSGYWTIGQPAPAAPSEVVAAPESNGAPNEMRERVEYRESYSERRSTQPAPIVPKGTNGQGLRPQVAPPAPPQGEEPNMDADATGPYEEQL